jgi:hypothetical protein
MAKRCAFLLAGLMVVASSTGCCCGLFGGGYRGNACSPCGNQCAPAYYPPGGMGYNQSYGATAFVGDGSIMAAAPGVTYPTTALAPMNSLPTY